jgi:hypothetical protein
MTVETANLIMLSAPVIALAVGPIMVVVSIANVVRVFGFILAGMGFIAALVVYPQHGVPLLVAALVAIAIPLAGASLGLAWQRNFG